MEHESIKTFPMQSRHAFHLIAEKLQSEGNYLENFLSFAKVTNTQRALIETRTLSSIPTLAINTLNQESIQVDIFLKIDHYDACDLTSCQEIINNLANLQVDHVILFDRPNRQQFWGPQIWVKADLVALFLEKYIPLAEECLQKGLTPVFPPLQPGGDYWDTAFLRLSLLRLKEKNATSVLNSLMLSTYCWTYGHTLDWGAGGPECWPSSTPYNTPENSQDQQGFHTYEWYQAHVKAVLDKTVPILLLEAGRSAECGLASSSLTLENQSATVQAILEQLYGQESSNSAEDNTSDMLPEEIKICNFLVDLDWASLQDLFSKVPHPQMIVSDANDDSNAHEQKTSSQEPIQHYLLLPDESWLNNEEKATLLQPFIHRYHPVVGTSLDDAAHAQEITLVLTNDQTTDERIQFLQKNEDILLRKMRL